jgi:general secretion pathway protein K
LADNHELEKVFRRFLGPDVCGLPAEEVNTILYSVMDWIDSSEYDGVTEMDGAEDDYYMSLERPYHCKNGPLDSLEELLLVKGVTPELFYGTKDRPGIAPYISVFGEDGKININTADPKYPKADPMLLMSLHDHMTKAIAEDMADYRIDADEDQLSSSKWYEKAGVPGYIDLSKGGIITTKSSHFQIISIGHFGDVTKSVKAVVKRDPDKQDFQILSWKIE